MMSGKTRKWSRWWGFEGVISPAQYIATGVLLAAVKLPLNYLLATRLFGRPWLPVDYAFPVRWEGILRLQGSQSRDGSRRGGEHERACSLLMTGISARTSAWASPRYGPTQIRLTPALPPTPSGARGVGSWSPGIARRFASLPWSRLWS